MMTALATGQQGEPGASHGLRYRSISMSDKTPTREAVKLPNVPRREIGESKLSQAIRLEPTSADRRKDQGGSPNCFAHQVKNSHWLCPQTGSRVLRPLPAGGRGLSHFLPFLFLPF